MLLQKFAGLSLTTRAGAAMLMAAMAPALALNPQPLPLGYTAPPAHSKQVMRRHVRRHLPVKHIKHGPHN